jgi:hypothetical protein
MASLSAYYPLPVVAGTTAGTYAEGNDPRFGDGLEEAPEDGIIYGRKDADWVDMTAPANLQVRRGTAAEVAAVTPLEGEPVWATDTKQLFIGDGAKLGGVPVSLAPRAVTYEARATTTDNTPTELRLFNNQRITIPNNTALFATVEVVATGRTAVIGESAHYIRKVAIERRSGTTTLLGSVSTVGTDYESRSAFNLAITADSANSALRLMATGREAIGILPESSQTYTVNPLSVFVGNTQNIASANFPAYQSAGGAGTVVFQVRNNPDITVAGGVFSTAGTNFTATATMTVVYTYTAGGQTLSVSFSGTAVAPGTNADANLEINKFNSNLGTLTGVAVTVNQVVTGGSFTVSNQDTENGCEVEEAAARILVRQSTVNTLGYTQLGSTSFAVTTTPPLPGLYDMTWTALVRGILVPIE